MGNSLFIWVFQCGISTIFAFRCRVSKSSLNTIKLSFILIGSIQILITLATNLFGIFNLQIFNVLLIKNFQLLILSFIFIVMIYKLIKDMLKYSVLKDYIIRDSFLPLYLLPLLFIKILNTLYLPYIS